MSIFGWSLPPGCSSRDIDALYASEEGCECCGNHIDDCICPTCECGECGNPACYQKHGLALSPTQRNLFWVQTIRLVEQGNDQKAHEEAFARFLAEEQD